MLLRPALAALTLAACVATPESKGPEAGPLDARKLLTLEQTAGRGEKVDFGATLARYEWARDGVHLEHTEGEKTVWIDPATWAESEAAAETKEQDDGALAKALVAAGVPEERAKKVGPRSTTRAASGGALVQLEGELWWVQDGVARQLAGSEGGAPELAELSPDGARVAFVQANDLVVVDTASGERRELTSDGSGDVLNGKLDWVYQEEVYGRGDFRAFWWSPDARSLAFLRLDESKVQDFTVVDNIEDGHFRVKPEVTRYPKVGDPNPVAALGIADAAGAGVRWIDLSAHAADEPLVVRVGWNPAGALVYMLQDRVQTWLELCAADAQSGAARTLVRETSSSWVDRAEAPRWLADGSFLWASARTGARHLELRAADGTIVRALTSGDWSVRDVDALDAERGLVWFTATKDGAVDSNLYRIELDGTGLVRLTSGPGRHQTRWNGARTLFLDQVSTLDDPGRLDLCDGDGKVLRTLDTAKVPDFEAYATSRWELHHVRARDGFELDVAVLKPVPFDPAKEHPVWISTYSGPDAPSVANTWIASPWSQFLAQNGVVNFQVNVRSASGKGPAATSTCYLQLGVQELADLEDAVDWLSAEPWADGARVGITGGSYGGFMTAYALTHSDRFALGIAASGVYDWRMYDTIYTERYMSTPERNPDGYAKTSVLAAAANLKGHLVITHGETDDNVHWQNAVQLVWALEKADRDFELVLYPQQRHGIRDPDLRWWDRRLAWRQIQEHLLGVEL